MMCQIWQLASPARLCPLALPAPSSRRAAPLESRRPTRFNAHTALNEAQEVALQSSLEEEGPSTSPGCEALAHSKDTHGRSTLFQAVAAASPHHHQSKRAEQQQSGNWEPSGEAQRQGAEFSQQQGKSSVISIASTSSAGQAASHLAYVLRMRKSTQVQFVNSRGILKALKALAITHDFLSQHGSTLSFVPSGYEVTSYRAPEEEHAMQHQQPHQQLHQQQDQQQQKQRTFTLDVWQRKCHHREVETRVGQGPPLYDFSLDARREWKSKAAVSEDMAYSLADMLYGQLVLKPVSEGVALPAPEPQRRQYDGVAWSGPVLLSADMAQSATLFMALALFQQRLTREGQTLEVVCTVYRNTIAPRLDGRNGFIFKVLTRPASFVAARAADRQKKGPSRQAKAAAAQQRTAAAQPQAAAGPRPEAAPSSA